MNPDNAADYLAAGASHVIVTSYVFKDGSISWENLDKMEMQWEKNNLFLISAVAKKMDKYYSHRPLAEIYRGDVTLELMEKLGSYCDEFLVHAVDVEGKAHGS